MIMNCVKIIPNHCRANPIIYTMNVAHSGILLPLSQHLSGLFQATGYYSGPGQVILPDTSPAGQGLLVNVLGSN